MLASKQVQHDLEFDKILDLVKAATHSSASILELDQQDFIFDRLKLIRALSLVKEMLFLLSEKVAPKIFVFVPIDEHLRDLRPENGVIGLERVLEIRDILNIYNDFSGTWKREETQKQCPFLFQLMGSLEDVKDVLAAIDEVIDKEGEVRDDASEGLVSIRRKQRKIQGAVSAAFNQALKRFSSHLIESKESFKNGRRVLAVRAESRRMVPGMIHDESTTGKTVFIEPDEVLALNHKAFELEMEERKEIYKIIQSLCGTLRMARPRIKDAHAMVVQVDVIRAKALLAQKMDGQLPEILDHPHLEWLQARHPLLILKNASEGKEVVPSDFTLFGKNKVLLISGPNAGGKSIALKTCALLQLMTQFGLLVPCEEQSKAGIFSQIMVDIGDQQSIENDLSTYSSFLKNMKEMLDKADKNTLILIDEFGSGTDPTTGGALAEAILSEFLNRKCFGVITTHYSNLKVFAFKNHGVVNAAMQFDEKALTPTYKLMIGKPGSSFAFEIAQKMELPQRVLKKAKKRLGSKHVKVEDLLVSIQSEKNQLERELEELQAKETQLDKLIVTYTQLQDQLDYKRKKIKLENREKKLAMESEFNRKLENTIREIQEKKNIGQAKKIAQAKKAERAELSQEVHQLQEDIFAIDTQDQNEILEGDHVKMRNGDVAGEVERISKEKATVIFGGLKIDVPLRDLKKVKAPIPVKKRHGIYTEVHRKAHTFKSKIDIRGLKMEDAQQIIQTFLDEALVAGVSRLEILHGKGSGILRKVVKSKAKEYNQISSITHPDPDNGGEGVSILILE